MCLVVLVVLGLGEVKERVIVWGKGGGEEDEVFLGIRNILKAVSGKFSDA